MRICIRPDSEPRREIDITRRLVAVVAEELWLACGGNDQLNWLEAEMHVAGLARGVADSPSPPPVASDGATRAPGLDAAGPRRSRSRGRVRRTVSKGM